MVFQVNINDSLLYMYVRVRTNPFFISTPINREAQRSVVIYHLGGDLSSHLDVE